MKRGLFAELKRRNVYRPAILYVGAVWALAQGIAQLSPVLGAPPSLDRWFLVAATIGFPFWIAFAWLYELTPEGLRRETEDEPATSATRRTSRKLDLAIIGVLSVAVVLLLTDRFALRGGADAATTTVSARSIAVLPFSNLSSDRSQEYFSEGIAEDLLNLLTEIPQLRVTARTSSFAFRGRGLGVPEIARRLHVANVLEGSVEKAGDEVRITAQLVDAGTDTQLWSKSYDRRLTDVFAIQDSIAADVVRHLKVKLLGAAPTVRTTDPKAYALYLQARAISRQLSNADLTRSDSLFRRVLAIDPRYVAAWNGLASNFSNEVVIGMLSSKEGDAQARHAYDEALAIDPNNARALAGLGWIAMYGGKDLGGAAKQIQRALALDPADPNVLEEAASLLTSLGRVAEGVRVEEAIVKRNPVAVVTLYNLGVDQLWAGHPDSAMASFQTALNLSPRRGVVHYLMGVALLMKGEPSEALAQMKRETSETWRTIGLSLAYHALGRAAASDSALATLIAGYGKDWPYNIASVYAYRGQATKAFEWLDRAVESDDSGLGQLVPDNLFDNIHSDPRWVPFLRKLGVAPDQLARIHFKLTLPASAAASP